MSHLHRKANYRHRFSWSVVHHSISDLRVYARYYSIPESTPLNVLCIRAYANIYKNIRFNHPQPPRASPCRTKYHEYHITHTHDNFIPHDYYVDLATRPQNQSDVLRACPPVDRKAVDNVLNEGPRDEGRDTDADADADADDDAQASMPGFVLMSTMIALLIQRIMRPKYE